MTKKFDIQKFNNILEAEGNKLRMLYRTREKIEFSNGLILTSESDMRKCIKRIFLGEKIWATKFDLLYDIDQNVRLEAEKYCKSIICSKGGVHCQSKYGDKIKKNLNRGTPWNKGLKGNYPYHYPCKESTKQKISEANSAEKNGMYGRKMSAESKHMLSTQMKNKILNGEFTPNSNNRNAHWEAFYNGMKFRSSWEALYQCLDPDAEYEKIRIPYSFESKQYVYIVDFVNHTSKILVEVKPRELLSSPKIRVKIDAAVDWCKEQGYTLLIADLDYFKSCCFEPHELMNFDQKTASKIKKIYEINC